MKYEDEAILEQGNETGSSTIFDDVFRTIAQKKIGRASCRERV